MKLEKAISYLEWIRPKKPYTLDKKNVQEAIDMAIAALRTCEECVGCKEKPHGEWIDRNGNSVFPFWERYECSKCGARSDNTNFCPNCGADMRKEGEAE